MPVRLLHYSDLERAFDDPAHAARVAAVVAERRCSQTLVLGTGDNTAPSVLGGESNGRQALDFFNAVGTDYETFGNHDFDHGLDATRALVRDAPNEWLTANVFDSDGSRFGEPHTAPWAVADVEGTRVGLVGVTTPETPVRNIRAASLTVTDPVTAVNEAVADLREEDVEFLVVLAHVGDSSLADAVDVDVVLDGHCHDPVVSQHDGTAYVRTGDGGMQLAEVRLSDDSVTVEQHLVAEATVQPNESLEQALATRIATTGLDEVVTRVVEPVGRNHGTLDCAESPLGNTVADAIRWATDADTAVIPVGVLRTGPPLVGDVTAFDLHRVAPFDDECQVVECTGTDLRAAVSDLSLTDIDVETPTACFGHVSGMHVVWDDEQATVRELRIDGESVAADGRYTLATVGAALRSSTRLTAVDDSDIVSTYDGEHPLVAYVRWAGLDTEVDGRIERPTLGSERAP